MKLRIALILVLFAVGTLFLWNPIWLNQPAYKKTGLVKSLPDFTANDMSLKQYNEQGFLESIVHAKTMVHYKNQNTTFTKPSYIIYPEQGDARWKIQADIGIYDLDKRVILQDNVVINAINPDEKIQRISTSYLELNIKTMVVTSDQQIEINGSQFHILGQGLAADLKTQQFELIKDIQAVYENNQS